MSEPTASALSFPSQSPRDVLTQILHEKAGQMLGQMIAAEADQ